MTAHNGVDALRARLSELSGTDRTRPLLELGQLLADRYWRAEPGSTAARSDLDAAVAAIQEAHDLLDPTDRLRGTVAGSLGWLLATRYTAHGGADSDREAGIRLLNEALTFPDLPPNMRRIGRLCLGQLYLQRCTSALQGSALATALQSGVAPDGGVDADRAVACFRQVLAEEQQDTAINDAAKHMLAMAEAMQSLMSGFGKGFGGFDLGRMMEAMATLQRLQQDAAGSAMPTVNYVERMAASAPLDRPVALHGAASTLHVRTGVRTGPDAGAARAALRALLAPVGDLLGLLHADAVPPAFDVDEFVALAATAAHDDDSAATDELALAVALYLRSRADDDGWGDDTDGGDAAAAAERLRSAATTAPADAEPILLRLADRLGRFDTVEARFTAAVAALRTIGADALVYPQPDRWLLLDAATGRFARDAAPPNRVLVVGDDPLDGPFDDCAVSLVSSAAQLVAVATRTPAAVADAPVFVANPRGDQEWASIETLLLRRMFYLRSTGLGRTVEYTDGAGTPQEVLAHLDASMLFLGCGVTPAGALELAGQAELDLSTVTVASRPVGGVAVLPPVGDGLDRLADVLLGIGFTGVVGWLRPVPVRVAALAGLVLHAGLVHGGLTAAAAVHAVRRWMRDPDRTAPPDLPEPYAATMRDFDLTDPDYWRALVHRGAY